jgi:fermentation-respiration switch protein FrsA (DUF1100 family)
MERIYHFAITLAIAYFCVLLLLRIFESHLIYFPNYPGRLAGDWQPHGLPVEDVWITAHDGTRLNAWWIPSDKASFTFLAFHGNAGNISDRAYVYGFLHGIPANVLALEYRGYGKSGGKPGEKDFYLDAQSALAYLVLERHIDPSRVISFGQSLGTAVAANLASESNIGGVVLEAPFPSLGGVARRIYWFLPGVGLVAGSQFDTKSKLSKIKAPILIVQCAQDPVIPPDLGRQVYDAARQPKTLMRFDMLCHEESSLLAPSKYESALKEFLARAAQRGNGDQPSPSL